MLEWMAHALDSPGYMLTPGARLFAAAAFVVIVSTLFVFIYTAGLVVESLWLGAVGILRK